MSTPIETAAEALYEHVGTVTPDLEADGVPEMDVRRIEAHVVLASLAQHRDRLQRLAAEHEYAINHKSGAICSCGYAPPRVERPWPWGQQDWHREHLVDTLLALITGEKP